MILTVTLNPSLDRTLRVAALVRGAVLRAEGVEADPGGKGVNVARALARHGDEVLALLPAGGSVGRAITALLAEAGVPAEVVAIAGSSRANITVVEPDGTTTKLNEPGPTLGTAELATLVTLVGERVGRGDWVVAAGSLPPGVPNDAYARIGAVAHDRGALFALDSSGPPFVTALSASPDLVKPNREELQEAVGHAVTTVAEVVSACGALQARGVRDVVCSLGGDGAVLVSRTGAWHARGPVVDVRNTVGAGDALLAGFLHAGAAGATGPESLRTGVAWATAAVATSGTGVPLPHNVHLDHVVVVDVTDASAPHLNPLEDPS